MSHLVDFYETIMVLYVIMNLLIHFHNAENVARIWIQKCTFSQ